MPLSLILDEISSLNNITKIQRRNSWSDISFSSVHFPHRNLFPCGDSMVCIIDDREDVWKFAPNLITVKKYIYFQGTGDINAPPGSREAQTAKKGQVHSNLSITWSLNCTVSYSLCNAQGQMYRVGCAVQRFLSTTLHIHEVNNPVSPVEKRWSWASLKTEYVHYTVGNSLGVHCTVSTDNKLTVGGPNLSALWIVGGEGMLRRNCVITSCGSAVQI